MTPFAVVEDLNVLEEAAVRGLPIMAINQGRTRADDLITHKLDDDCAALLATAID